MASLALALLVVILILLLVFLLFPTWLIIEARQDGPRTTLRLAVGLLAGRLRLSVFAVPSRDPVGTDRGQSDGLLEWLQSMFARFGPAASRTRKLPRQFALLRRAVSTAWWAVKQPGCRCTKLDVEVCYGLGDASATALATGLAHAAFATSQSALMNSVHFARGVHPRIHLAPSYERIETRGAVDCIFSIPLGYIIGRGVARLLRLRFSPKKVA